MFPYDELPTPTLSPTNTSTLTPTNTPTPACCTVTPLPSLVVKLPSGVPLEMVRIPAGQFQMGYCVKPDQCPPHIVDVKSFYIGKYEITKEQWDTVMRSNPQGKRLSQYPAYASWYGCQEFISALNKLGQGTFRLPSEAEWEYAAGQTSFYFYYFMNYTLPAGFSNLL